MKCFLLVILSSFFFSNVFATNNLKIKAYLPDGTCLKDNHVFQLNDECYFKLESNSLESDFISLKWTFEGLNKTTLKYNIIHKKTETDEYCFKLDTAVIDYKHFLDLKKDSLPGDSSIFFVARIFFEGITAENEALFAEMPIYLNLLPSRAEFKLLSCQSTKHIDDIEQYEFYTYKTSEKYNVLRSNDILLYKRSYLDGTPLDIGIIPISLNDEIYTGYVYSDVKMLYQFTATNIFGSVKSAVFNMNEIIKNYYLTTLIYNRHYIQ